MISSNRSASLIASAVVLAASTMSIQSANARGFGAFGARGSAGGYVRNGAFGSQARFGGAAYGGGAGGIQSSQFAGPFGGRFSGMHGGIVTPNAGLAGGAYSARGAYGGTAQSSGVAGYARGVGAFEGTNTSLRGAGGSTYNGSSRGVYNAQTGTGSYDADRQVFDAKSGQNYGYTKDTTYTQGQGGQTQIDTDHHGDYTVDWGNGQMPTVIKDSNTTTSGNF